MRWGAAIVLLGCACSPVAVGPNRCRAQELTFERLLRIGEPVDAIIGVQEICDDIPPTGFHTATRVDVEVVSPSGTQHPFVASAPHRSDGGFRSFENYVEVTFTPDRPGTWELRANFEPSIGQTRRFLLALPGFSDAGYRDVDAGMLGECTQYDITPQGTVFCSFNANNKPTTSITTQRGQTIEGRRLAFGGGALWRLTTDGLHVDRFVDDGTQFRATHSGAVVLEKDTLAAANGEGAWLFTTAPDASTPSRLIHLEPEPDGGVTSAIQSTMHFDAVALSPQPDQVQVMGYTGPAGAALMTFGPDGGTRLTTLAADLIYLVGVNDQTIWLSGMGVIANTTHPARFPASGLIASFSSGDTFWPYPTMVSAQYRPELALAPREDDAGLSLEVFENTATRRVVTVTRAHVFAQSSDGTLRIYDRAP